MLRSTAVNVTALVVLTVLGTATFAATRVASPSVVALAERGVEPGVETGEPGPGTPEATPLAAVPEPAAETVEAEPVAETGEAAPAGFGAQRSEQARAFGDCMREHGGAGTGNAACAAHKPGPAHLAPGHPGRGPEAKPEHAGQGKPEHAGQGKPEHAGQGKPEHAGRDDEAEPGA